MFNQPNKTAAISLDRKYHARFATLVIAYAITLRAHLQRTVVPTELEALLPHWECDQIRVEPCPPALICMKMSHLIDEAVSQNPQRSAEFHNFVSFVLVGRERNWTGWTAHAFVCALRMPPSISLIAHQNDRPIPRKMK